MLFLPIKLAQNTKWCHHIRHCHRHTNFGHLQWSTDLKTRVENWRAQPKIGYCRYHKTSQKSFHCCQKNLDMISKHTSQPDQHGWSSLHQNNGLHGAKIYHCCHSLQMPHAHSLGSQACSWFTPSWGPHFQHQRHEHHCHQQLPLFLYKQTSKPFLGWNLVNLQAFVLFLHIPLVSKHNLMLV